MCYVDVVIIVSCRHADDPDELEVYGSFHSSGPILASFNFEVCDSLLNIGPISDVTIAQPAFLSVSGPFM